MALSMTGIPFRETVIPLDTPETAKLIAEHSAAGRVPVLYHGRQVVWESLAIMEYLAELFPEKNLWPKTISARSFGGACGGKSHCDRLLARSLQALRRSTAGSRLAYTSA
jgi:glutathione S-transferase